LGRLDGRLALITGASRGFGAALAERFAEEGARLILVARTAGGLEEVDDRVRAAGGEATLVPQDLTNGAAIDELGGAIAQRFGHLDILIGNAAELASLSPLAHVDPKTFEQSLALLATTNYRLIRSFDSLLHASDAGRAIFITSDVAQAPRAFWGAHAAGKAALEALVMTYAAETARRRNSHHQHPRQPRRPWPHAHPPPGQSLPRRRQGQIAFAEGTLRHGGRFS